MEHGVHVLRLVQTVEHGTRDVTDALGDEPDDSRLRHTVHQGLKSHEHTQAHADETECLEIRMFLQADETGDGARYRTSPYEDEETPAPVTLTAQRHQRQRRVRTSDMPIDGSMVPFAQPLLPLRVVFYRVVERRGQIRAEHAEEIEDDAYARPVVVSLEAPNQEDDAEHHPKQNATSMGSCIPYLLFLRIFDQIVSNGISNTKLVPSSYSVSR